MKNEYVWRKMDKLNIIDSTLEGVFDNMCNSGQINRQDFMLELSMLEEIMQHQIVECLSQGFNTMLEGVLLNNQYMQQLEILYKVMGKWVIACAEEHKEILLAIGAAKSPFPGIGNGRYVFEIIGIVISLQGLGYASEQVIILTADCIEPVQQLLAPATDDKDVDVVYDDVF